MAAQLNPEANAVTTAWYGQGGSTLRRLLMISTIPYAFAVSACGGAVAPPEDTLRAWSNAVEREDCAGMYALLASDVRSQVTEETFEQWCVGQRDAMQTRSDLIQDSLASGASAHVVARVPIGPFHQVRVRLVDNKWQLDQPLPLLSGADDPLSAVAELSRVIDGPQADQFLGMMSPELRTSFLGRLHAVRSLMLAGDPASLVVTSDTAQMVVGTITISFRLRDGVWTIEDLSDSQSADMYYDY
jgi:hypothetical protein